MEQYKITGMSCAACSARVEKAVLAVPGVESCAVSLLTNSMGVSGTADKEAVIKAVMDAGYGASLKNESTTINNKNENELEDTDTPRIRKRLIASLVFLLPLIYVSMGNMLFGWPLPGFLRNNHLGIGLYELIITACVMVINQKFFINGFKGLLHKSPNMDTLVALGASASFGYSVFALFAMTVEITNGNHAAAMKYMDEFYFESAAMILTLITVGKMLEAKSKGKTTDALKGLMKLAPMSARVIRNNEEVTLPIEQVKAGDIFTVRPGEQIPVDGIVKEGNSAINEAALTGESLPVDKTAGDSVSAGTINQSGYLVCEASRVGEDTTLSQIIKMVSDAAATKAPIAKLADRVSGVFVPAVMLISLITFIIWLLAGQNAGFSLARAISVLVISCPCALGLATPVAIMVGNGCSARNGIMFKTAVSLEETGKAQIVVLDKTGTITKGEPSVRLILPAENIKEEELLEKAYSLEKLSEHPLARAITLAAEEKGCKALEVSDFKSLPGQGLTGKIDGHDFYGGNRKLIEGRCHISSEIERIVSEGEKKGMTPLFFAAQKEFLGAILVADPIKEDSVSAIENLKKMGLSVVMLTGDNANTANAIGEEVGVDRVVSGVLPNEKEAVISALQEKGRVIMVGDGINDAPALTRADIGIAIGAGTDIAIDAADVVLMKSRLSDVAAAIRISRKTLKNIKENLFWAFFYNVIGIPLAAGLWIPIFGWTLNPMFGAAAMSLSSFFVVTNALRLNLIKVHDSTRDRAIKNKVILEKIEYKKEKEPMKVTVKGMMCGHCEAHVKKAIEKIPGVTEVVADHTANLVTITAETEIAEADVKAAVEAEGYEYIGIVEM